MSINLTATNQSLELVTTAATQTQVVVSARDNAAGSQTPISQDTNIAAAGTTTIEAAPAASTQRMTDDIEVIVIGAGQQGVKVQKNVGGTVFALLNVSLQTNERAHFTNDMGWRLFDALGREKNTVGYSLIKPATLDLTAGAAKTYTPSVGCTAIMIEGWGSGGQGGGAPVNAANNASCGTGGNEGGYFRKFIVGVPSSFLYTIGAAPTPAAAGAAGAVGTNTTAGPINGATYTATAGLGGQILATGTANGEAVPSAAVSASVVGGTLDETLPGKRGESSFRVQTDAAGAGTAVFAMSGKGGDSQVGTAGRGRASTGAGDAATGNGAGGGGACALSGGAAQVGGTGTPGAMRFWEFTG